MKQSIKCLLIAFATMFVSAVAFAQVTTSALSGRIVDVNGEAVIGATVVATHEPSGTVYGVSANNDGRYAIQGMRSGGPYKVEVSCIGYQTVTYTEVTLQLAEVTSINVELKDDAGTSLRAPRRPIREQSRRSDRGSYVKAHRED